MYREQIDNFIDSKKEEMLEDLKSLVRINSQRGEASPGKPFGDGPAEALAKGQELMEQYGLKTRKLRSGGGLWKRRKSVGYSRSP